MNGQKLPRSQRQSGNLQTEFDELSTTTGQTINIPNLCTMTENMNYMPASSERRKTFSTGTITHRLEKTWDLVPSYFRHRIRHSVCEMDSDTVRNARPNNSTAHGGSGCKENTHLNVDNDLILVSRNDSQKYRKQHESDHPSNTKPVWKSDSLPMTCNRGGFQNNRKENVRSIQTESSTADGSLTVTDHTSSNPHSDLVLVSRDKTRSYRKQHQSPHFANTRPAAKTDLSLVTGNREELQNNRKGHDIEYTMTKSCCASDKLIPQKSKLQQPTAMFWEKCHINSCGGESNKPQVAEFKPRQKYKTGFYLQNCEQVGQSDCTDKIKVKLVSDGKVSTQRTRRKRHSSSHENTNVPTKKVNYTVSPPMITLSRGEPFENVDTDTNPQESNATNKTRPKKIRQMSSKVTLKKVDGGKSNNKSLQCLKNHSRGKTSTAKHSIDVGDDQGTESEMLKLKAVDEIHKQIADSDEKQRDYGNESVDLSHLHELIPLDSNTRLGRRKVKVPNVIRHQSVLQRRYSTNAIWERVVSKYD